MRPDMLEVTGPAVLLREEGLARVEFAGSAAGAFGGVGAIIVGNVIVADVAEPAKINNQNVIAYGTKKIYVNLPVNLGRIGE